MNGITQNSLDPRLFKIPEPPEEFGQDGGKFYHCYDALAKEIDDDTVTGLKEQLDGMLIFAGLFAAVNTAFLALTLPLLSPDPADDTNSLLSQNNAILIQLLRGRNDSAPTSFPLPSASFSPSPDIAIINALFALSLAFAIISSFLAVLGRQWLVYYRKRSGGGPDYQRWEQLRRFMGAERWRLQAILDDVLPSLLQIGLIIFCVSFVLYLRHLNRTISLIVAIPMYVGLAFFVGGALCTVWDKFCPFHSPLSHILVAVCSAISIPGASNLFKCRRDESPTSLQVRTLKRAFCTSDDPATLLYATSNILGIKDVSQMEELWDDETFRGRFLDQYQNSYARMLQLCGREGLEMALAARRIYCGAAAHIMLVLDSALRRPGCRAEVHITKAPSTSIALEELPGTSISLIRATLKFPVPKFDWPDKAATAIQVHLAAYHSNPNLQPGWRLFFFVTWVAVNVHTIPGLEDSSQEPLQQVFEVGDVESMIQTLGNALKILTGPKSKRLVDRDNVMTNILHGIRQIIIAKVQPNITLQNKFALLEICEPIMRSPRLPEAARRTIRRIRVDLAQTWKEEYDSRVIYTGIPTRPVDMLEKYLAGLKRIYPAEEYREYIEVLQAFGPAIRRLFRYSPNAWVSRKGFKRRIAFHESFNNYVLDIDNMARQVKTLRDPDGLWCHRQKETVPIRAIYSQPAEGPNSWWRKVQELPEMANDSPHTSATLHWPYGSTD